MEPPDPVPPVAHPTVYAIMRAYAADMRATGKLRDAWFADTYADHLARLSGYDTPARPYPYPTRSATSSGYEPPRSA